MDRAAIVIGQMKNRLHKIGLATALVVSASLLLAACDGPAEREAAYLERAKALYEEGRYVKAKLDFRNALQINPKNHEAYYYVALIDEFEGDFQAAGQGFSTAANLNPNHLPSQIRVGTYFHLAGALEAADQAADLALAMAPADPDALALKAANALKRGQIDQALELANAALESAPFHEGATAVQVGAMVGQNAVGDAITLLAQTLEQKPASIALRLLKIQLHANREELDEIELLYRELVALRPKTRVYLTNLARILIKLERSDDAEALLLEAIEKSPEDVGPRLLLADFISTQRGLSDAEDALLEFIDNAPQEDAYRFGLAALYTRSGDAARSAAVYHDIIERAGTAESGLAARLALARQSLVENDRATTSALIAEVLEIDPRNVNALIFRAGLRLEDDTALDSVIADLRTVLRDAPTSRPGLNLLANAYLRKGETELASDIFQTMVVADPQDLQAQLRLAQLLWRDDQTDAAFDLVSDVLALAPGEVDALRMKAGIAIDLKLWDHAQSASQKLMAIDGQEALGHQAVAMTYQAQGQHENAIASFQKALALEPTADEAIVGVARSFAAANKLSESVEYLETIVAEVPDHAVAQNILGEVYASVDDFDRAESAFSQATKLRPEWTQPHINLGRVLIEEGDPKQAIQVLEAVRDQSDGDPRVDLALASAFEKSGAIDAAIDIYANLLDRAPALDAAANNMAALISDYQYEQPESVAKALAAANRFQTSNDVFFLDTLGWVHYRAGNLSESVRFLERALRSGKSFPQLHYHLGMAYHASGMPEQAKVQLEKALAEEAAYPGASEARDTLDTL